MDANSFNFETLNLTGRVFRLLRLKKGVGRHIECELILATLDDPNNRYEAVSYTWGPNEEVGSISVNGKRLHITLNLYLILHDLLRLLEEDRILWIDAVCINEKNDTEKGHQVQQMKDVYKNAERVLFCASRPMEMTDILMTSLEALENQSSNRNETPGNSSLEIDEAWEKIQVTLGNEYIAPEQRQKLGREHILSQPWFSRVWILQEVANARKALAYCGKRSVSASILAISPRLIDVRRLDSQRFSQSWT
jgi:hypothetical protein